MPLQGEQIPLPIAVPPVKRRLWLQIERQGTVYTYDEFKKKFTHDSWDAKHYPTLGRARTARYALRANKQLKKEFPGCAILIYDADLQKVIDPESPPEPKSLPPLSERFPLCDNADRLPWCPECGGLLQTALSDCETCGWQFAPLAVSSQPLTPHPSPLTPQIEALKQSRSQLMHQIDGIRRSGDVAPKGCSMEPYTVSKTLAGGKKKKFIYYRIKSDAGAILQNKHGQATKSLHLGVAGSAAHRQWCERLKRRNAITLLERHLDKAERGLQRLKV